MARKDAPNLAAGRQTRPETFDGATLTGGLGVVARQGWDARTAAFIELASSDGITGLTEWASLAPLHLLRVLIALNGMGQMALSNDLSLAFGPGDVRIVAVKDSRGGKGTVDDSETEVLSQLWKKYDPGKSNNSTTPEPQIAGAGDMDGFTALCKTLGTQTNESGLYCFEGAILRPSEGIGEIADFDPLSVRYRDTDKGRILEQRQRTRTDKKQPGWIPLEGPTIFCKPWLGAKTNPYGRPRYGAFLGTGLSWIRHQRNLDDWLHYAAWPRIVSLFPLDEQAQYAKENPDVLVQADGTTLSASTYAMQKMVEYKQLLATMTSDDIILLVKGGTASSINPSDISGLSEVYHDLRLAVIQSLDQLPTMMGVTDGGTQAYASANGKLQAQKLEDFRAHVVAGPVALANLDLRLRGVDMIAKAEMKPILLSDLLAHQQAREIEIRNEFALVDRGMTSPEQAAMNLTGSGVFDASRVYQAVATPTPTAPEPAGNNA